MPEITSIPIFDAHFHIIDYRFPVYENQGYMPPEFTLRDYLEKVKGWNVRGGAVVAGSFHKDDISHILSCLSVLGKNFVGVINPIELSQDLVEKLNAKGIGGVRFNLVRCGKELVSRMEKTALFIWEKARWHIELYVKNSDLKELSGLVRSLPAVSIAHLGLTKDGFDELLKLVENGNVVVKATGFGRLDFDPVWAIKEILSVREDAVVFGTDLPSTRAKRPFSWQDLRLIANNLPQDLLKRVLWNNACKFYLSASPEGSVRL